MAFPERSKFFNDGADDDNDIKKRYALTELTEDDARQLAMAEVYTGDAFPDNTIFVRYPKNQPPNQPGGYLSVLAADIDSVVQTASTMGIEITFFKGEKNPNFKRVLMVVKNDRLEGLEKLGNETFEDAAALIAVTFIVAMQKNENINHQHLTFDILNFK
jgi:hypothetical protein